VQLPLNGALIPAQELPGTRHAEDADLGRLAHHRAAELLPGHVDPKCRDLDRALGQIKSILEAERTRLVGVGEFVADLTR